MNGTILDIINDTIDFVIDVAKGVAIGVWELICLLFQIALGVGFGLGLYWLAAKFLPVLGG